MWPGIPKWREVQEEKQEKKKNKGHNFDNPSFNKLQDASQLFMLVVCKDGAGGYVQSIQWDECAR